MSSEVLRLTLFLSIFTGIIVLETLAPKRPRQESRRQRWRTNISLAILNTLVFILIPLTLIDVSQWTATHQWGVFRQPWAQLPTIAELFASILLLDLAIYGQHVASHKWPWFWRLHQVHHADRDLDASSAIRFHTIEIALSFFYKIALILILGCSPIAVLTFEIILNGMALFNHANLSLPRQLDRLLRLVSVTPDMHRIHHSTVRREQDSNYGFNFPWWDRLFGTYKDQPEKGHLRMAIGLDTQQKKSAAITRIIETTL